MATGTFRYPGSKTTLASWIIDYFPDHTQYIEAFGGAASVLVAKQRSELEVYNDINSDVVTFFRVARDNFGELAEWVEYTPTSRELFNEFVESYPDWPDDTIERAGRLLYVQHHAFGGKGVTENSPTYSICKSGSNFQKSAEGLWLKKPVAIEQIHSRFKGVNIEQLDFEDLIDKYDHEDAFFYFDPPYVDVGDNYYETEEGGFDHERFVNAVLGMDAKWLISYDHNIPEPLQSFHSVERTKKATLSVDNPEKVETLTMNYDPDKATKFSGATQQTLV